MLHHHLRHTLRHARRQLMYTVINVGGLALGLACCFLIALYIQDELSFDRMHSKADRIYRVEMDVQQSDRVERWGETLLPVAAVLQDRVASIETITRVQPKDEPLIARPGTRTRFYESHAIHAEPSLFDVFDFTILQGNADALGRPNQAFLSRSAAARYFPDENPVGQTIALFDKWSSRETAYEVAGIIEDMPTNVHFRADVVLSLATALEAYGDRVWNALAFTYAVRPATVSPEAFVRNIETADIPHARFADARSLAVAPLTRIHLHSTAVNDIAPQGDIRYIYLFAAIALLILLIACINYMNLATARSARRAKEVGIRKSVGATREHLIGQFLMESMLFTLLAALLALGVVQLVLPTFNTLMGRALTLPLHDPTFWGGLLGVSTLIGLLAGSYPAFALSLFRPATVLKGTVHVRTLPTLRKSLIVFQFAISVALIVSTIVIQRQLTFVQETRLGPDTEQLAILRTRTALPEASAETFRNALAALPGVQAVGRGSGMPGEPTAITWFDADQIQDFDGKPPVFDMFWVGPHFTSTLGLELAAGRTFDPQRPADAEGALLINEAAVAALGWDEPVGKTITFRDGQPHTVVGVVRDFHYKDMRTEIGPVMLELSPSARRYYAVSLATTDVPAVLAALEATWATFLPDQPFDYSFLDDDFAAMYRTERRLGQLFMICAILAICIACFGLFGLTAFIVQQRTKEVGIRKVLGASMPNLLVLLSKDFVALVLIAFAVAGPVAYVAMERWLADFAYRTAIGWEIFAGAGGLALGIALLTISVHMLRVARANPVDSLRYE